jgi:hypothetical protein
MAIAIHLWLAPFIAWPPDVAAEHTPAMMIGLRFAGLKTGQT